LLWHAGNEVRHVGTVLPHSGLRSPASRSTDLWPSHTRFEHRTPIAPDEDYRNTVVKYFAVVDSEQCSISATRSPVWNVTVHSDIIYYNFFRYRPLGTGSNRWRDINRRIHWFNPVTSPFLSTLSSSIFLWRNSRYPTFCLHIISPNIEGSKCSLAIEYFMSVNLFNSPYSPVFSSPSYIPNNLDSNYK